MKSQLIRLALLGAVTVSVAACTGMETAKSGGEDQAAFEQIYKQAEEAYKKVADVNAWSTTEERLKNAKEAASKGDYKAAISLAKRAKFEDDMAYAQYESEKNAGPHLF